MLKYSHPTLALVLDYWPITIFAPTVLLLIATLALITRWWDRRDRAAQESVLAAASPPGAVVAGRRLASGATWLPPHLGRITSATAAVRTRERRRR
jgi:hypothetical protein